MKGRTELLLTSDRSCKGCGGSGRVPRIVVVPGSDGIGRASVIRTFCECVANGHPREPAALEPVCDGWGYVTEDAAAAPITVAEAREMLRLLPAGRCTGELETARQKLQRIVEGGS